jgi:uncharacterized DUF497 family protein
LRDLTKYIIVYTLINEGNMGKTVVSSDGCYEWDEEKDLLNKRKHGMCFSEILTVFEDPYILEMYDENHTEDGEERYIGIGKIEGLTAVVTCYTNRETRTRIYSARKATRKEQQLYNEKIKYLIGRAD